MLADPEIIMAEHQRLLSDTGVALDMADMQRQIDILEGQRRRLLKLYQMGEVDDKYLESESRLLRSRINEIKSHMQPRETTPLVSLDQLEQACGRVREWVEAAQGDDFALRTDALQIRVLAKKGEGELTGVIPEYASDNGHAMVMPCSCNGESFHNSFETLVVLLTRSAESLCTRRR